MIAQVDESGTGLSFRIFVSRDLRESQFSKRTKNLSNDFREVKRLLWAMQSISGSLMILWYKRDRRSIENHTELKFPFDLY